jgi:hypothetical protein
MICVWSDLVLGGEIECCLHDRPQLFWFDDMWGWPWSPTSTEHAARRNLVPLIFGMSVEAKSTDHIESGPCRVLRWRRTTPMIESIDHDVLFVKGFGVLRKKLERAVLFDKFASQITMEGDVA